MPVRINAVRNEELWSDPHSLCAGANECNTKRSRSKGFDPILRARPDPAPILSIQRAFKTTTAFTISFKASLKASCHKIVDHVRQLLVGFVVADDARFALLWFGPLAGDGPRAALL